MSTHRTARTVAAGLGGALALTASMVLAPSAQAADDPTFLIDPCDLTRTVEQLQDYGSDTDSNVIVYRADGVASEHFEGVARSGEFGDQGCNDIFTRTYKWVVFDGAGDFVRSGDGGYRNWSFYGVYDRPEENHVVFHPF